MLFGVPTLEQFGHPGPAGREEPVHRGLSLGAQGKRVALSHPVDVALGDQLAECPEQVTRVDFEARGEARGAVTGAIRQAVEQPARPHVEGHAQRAARVS